MKRFHFASLVLVLFLFAMTLISCGEDTPTTAAPGTTVPTVPDETTVAPETKPDETTVAPETKPDETEPVLQDITGVQFEDGTFTYDTTSKSLAVTGTLPKGVTVSYEGNNVTDAGTYTVKATLSGEGYKTLTLEATLTVEKAELTGFSAEPEQQVKEDGENHLPLYEGTLPTGVNVQYFFEGKEAQEGWKQPGTYAVEIRFTGKNYNTLTLNVTFKIKFSLGNLANSVIESFGKVPDVWSFLPESFGPEYHAIGAVPDYTDFTQINNIPDNAIGKQMDTVYGILTKAETAIYYLNKVYGSMNVIETLYANYLKDPNTESKNFEGNAGPFGFSIEVTDSAYYLRANISKVNILIFSDPVTKSYGARVQLTKETVLKYEITGEELAVGLEIVGSASAYLEFARDEEGNAIGSMYEYLTVAGKELMATSAMIYVNPDITVVIGTKGDFIPTSDSRNCEIYDNQTGCLIGSEVHEDVKGIMYNTYWFPLTHLQGLESIKKVDEMNGTNADTIYINGFFGEKLALHSKLVGGFSKKALSRRFDIEFKTVYTWQFNAETQEYESVKCEVPMLFVQEEFVADFDKDFNKENKEYANRGDFRLAVSEEAYNAIDFGYDTLLPIYNKDIKDAVTQQMIKDFCK